MFSLENESRTIRLTLLVAIAFTLAAGIAIVLAYGDYFLLGTYEKLNNDDVKYVKSARLLLEKNILAYNSGEVPSAFIMPGLPLMLAGLMAVFGGQDGGVVAFRLLQCFMQAASIYFVFVLVRHALGSRLAIVTAVAAALYPPDYFTSGVILTEGTFRFLFLLLLCFTIVAVKQNKTRYYVIGGVLWALVCYFRPPAALYPIVILLLWLRERYSWRDMLKHTVVVSVVFCVLLSPWWVRNLQSLGHWVTFTDSAGSPFVLGAYVYNAMPSEGFFETYPEYRNGIPHGGDQGMLAGKRMLGWGLTHEPVKYVYWYTIGKMVELYKWPFYWRTFAGIGEWFMNVVQQIIFVFGIAGIILAAFRRRANTLPVLLAFTYFTVIYLPFVTFSRYGYPNMFILIMFAAYAIEALLIASKKRAARRNAPPITAGG